jgi:3-dehydroquinate synthase
VPSWGFKMSFYIEKKKFNCSTYNGDHLIIKSIPNNYEVKFLDELNLEKFINSNQNHIILIDSLIKQKYFKSLNSSLPIYQVDANENNKNISKALDIISFFESVKVTKLNKVIVIGGGILQDLGAFACSMYKRGIPWIYVPTTFLGMTDSCVGGKTGLNYKNKKNILALFSAPRQVLINLNFLKTLSKRDFLSGLGEALRLHITGGKEYIGKFEKNIDAVIKKDHEAIKKIILNSLIIKKAVVEVDEFESNYRRSMNYGHSIGHALESITNFSFPHGMAVTIGICIENLIASNHYKLSKDICKRIEILAKKLIDKEALISLKEINTKDFSKILKADKKTIGSTLKLVVPDDYGKMAFKDFFLDNQSNHKISLAINNIL